MPKRSIHIKTKQFSPAPLRHAAALLLVFAPVVLTGCSGMGTMAPATSLSGSLIAGQAFGGQQPVSQASVQLYAVGTHGYGSASTALLSSPASTDQSGGFSIGADYTCPTPTSTVYLVVSGGNPGLPLLADNRSLVLMDVLGACGSLGTSNFIVVNELTTVAAAYALAPFALDYAHIGSSASNVQGLLNAVATAANLVSPNSGTSPGKAPSIASIPSAEINTLGNVLASCVNTNGSTAPNAPCGRLFNAVTPAGSSTPADTFAAALQIARNPAHNAAAVFGAVSSSPPFQPTLTSAPQDWTMAINWASPTFLTPGDLAVDSQGSVWILSNAPGSSSSVVSTLNASGISATFPQTASLPGSPSGSILTHIALDAFDNPWLSNASASTILELTSSGSVFSSSPFSGGGISGPGVLAFDASGNLWVADNNPTVSELTSNGSALSSGTSSNSGYGFPTTGSGNPIALALDTYGNAWLSDDSSNNIYVLDYNGYPIPGSPYSGGGIEGPSALAIDTTGGAWVANRTASSLSRLSSSGQPVFGSPYLGAGLNAPVAIALDGLDNVWLVNSGSNSLSEFLSTGSPQSGPAGYGSSALVNPFRAVIDRSGNIWVANLGTSSPGKGVITQIVGSAAPIITPVALAIQNNVLDQRP